MNWKKHLVKITIGVTIIIVIAIFCYVVQTRNKSSLLGTEHIGQVDPETVVSQSPDWNRYLKLDKELKKLSVKWKVDPISLRVDGRSATSGIDFEKLIDDQITIIKNNYQYEIDLKLNNLNSNLNEYSKNREEFYNLKLNERVNSINSALQKDLDEKKKLVAEEFEEYRKKIHANYQLDLTNLQLKLSMLDLISNQEEAKIERQSIQLMISRIKLEIEQQIESEYQRLQEELHLFSEQRQQKAVVDLEAVKSFFTEQYKKDVSTYQLKLEQEFESWRQKREVEILKAIELRKKQLTP